MKRYPTIKNIYEKCFMTWDNAPNVMLGGGGEVENRIQNCVYCIYYDSYLFT